MDETEFATEEPTQVAAEPAEEERRWMALGRERATTRDLRAQADAALSR